MDGGRGGCEEDAAANVVARVGVVGESEGEGEGVRGASCCDEGSRG